MSKRKIYLGCLIVGFGISNSLFAADNCTGHYVNVGQSAESAELSKGNSVAMFKVATVNLADDKNVPYHMSIGYCVGTALSGGNKTDARGHCIRKDKDGDVYNYEWTLPAGADKGTWKFTGGTGKYANAKWSGWWQQTAADGDTAGGIWGGNCR